jgi:hypothetical protein
MLLCHLGNRGLNLWCIEEKNIGLVENQATYDLPAGSVDVLNRLFCQHTTATTTESTTATSTVASLTADTRVIRMGVRFSTVPTGSFLLQSSTDSGATWSTIQTITDIPAANVWGWYDLDPTVETDYFRVSSATPLVTTDFILVTASSDSEMSSFNRDQYANQPNKTSAGEKSTSIYFQKTRYPSVTLWPVPSLDTNMIKLWIHRQVQDVGTLTQEIEVPSRWLDAITMQLAFRMSLEIPGVDPARIQMLAQLQDKFSIEADNNETDSAPSNLTPMIGGYTS